MKHKLKDIDRLRFFSKSGEMSVGGSQDWYAERWHRESGCGPVAASNLIWYASQMGGGIDEYIRLMHDVYPCYSPITRGVCSSDLFTRGIDKYKEKHGMHISANILEIPVRKGNRPSTETTINFIASCLDADSPVAFLNLTNGGQRIIEHWHWVTILSLDASSKLAGVSDYGKLKQIDIAKWLAASRLGGAMVSCTIEQ